MKRSLVFACFLLGALLLASAQDSAPAANASSIAGTVVKEPGSQPLKKVLLQLIAEDQKQGGNYTATTDSEGRFNIENVQPGRYRLFLERSGFIQINNRNHKVEGSALEVRAGQEMKDLVLRMLPTAVITGRVVDEDGDPLPNFGISVGRRKPGKTTDAEGLGGERTNDLGEYRISGLFPGQYFVSVAPAPDFLNLGHPETGSPDAKSKPDTNYLTTYYPGTTDATQASAITLRAGDEMPVNFTIAPARTYRIRGMVAGIPAKQKPMVQLVAKGVNSLTMNAADVTADGQFELRGVAPGSYSITAYSGSEGELLTARQNVTVVAADVEGCKLVPARPFTLSGHLRFEGQQPGDMTQYTVYLQSTDDLDDGGVTMAFVSGGGPVARVDRLGNFQWTGVTPGRYVAQVNGGEGKDGFLKSVALGSVDATAGFKVGGPASVDLVVSSKGGMLEGTVLENDQPVANASVVAVPEAKYRKIHGRFGIGSTDQNGHFVIHGLVPGSYTVFAWQDVEDGVYYDAEFLKSQEGNGTALKVEEGSRLKIELEPAPVSEEWQ
jgi:protocatechuate 3,4-dioxygenase beta subunit